MPKIIVKRKSTFIDMTAMSDVTVLLLTFFMLLGRLELFTVLLLFTSDFWKKN